MTEQTTVQIAEADVRSFAAKLSAFGGDLTPEEQAILAAIFNVAPDVEGFGGPTSGVAFPLSLPVGPLGATGPLSSQTAISPEAIARMLGTTPPGPRLVSPGWKDSK